MRYLILLLTLLPICVSAFDISKDNMGVCGYTKDFDIQAMNYKVHTNSIIEDIVTTKILGDYVRLANDITFDNHAEIIDKEDPRLNATGLLCDMQVALFFILLRSAKK